MPKWKVPKDILDMIPDIPGLNTTTVAIRIDRLLKGKKVEIVIDGKLYDIDGDKYLDVLSQIKSGLKNITISGIMFGSPFQDLGGQTFGVNSSVVKKLLEEPANFEAFIGQGVFPESKVVPYVGPTGATSGSTLNLEQGEVSGGGGQVGGPNFKDNKSKVVDVESFGAPKGQQATAGADDLPEGFKLEPMPGTGQLVPIPDTHGFTPEGKLVPLDQLAPSTGLPGQQPIASFSDGAKKLVDQALLEKDITTDLAQQPFWKNNAYKVEAFKMLNQIMGSPESLAKYVKEKGLTDLQQYDWWNGNDNKQAAFQLIESGQVDQISDAVINVPGGQIPDQIGSGVVGTPTTTITDETGATIEAPGPAAPGDPGTDPGTDPGDIDADAEAKRQQFKDELDKALAAGTINQDIYDMFLLTYDTWDPNIDVDSKAILDKFGEIKESTIDPYFKEQINIVTEGLKSSIAFQEQQREIELETEKALAGQKIMQAKGDLEKAGLTFSGQGVEQLGQLAAVGQPEAEGSAIPSQTAVINPKAGMTAIEAPFGGAFYEGTVNQANRLLSTSSLAKYKKNLQLLGESAETQLGTGAALGLNIPTYGSIGGVQGTIPFKQQQAYADALSQIAGQGSQNFDYSNPLNYGL